MTINLSSVTFTNDMYTLSLEDGGYLILNRVDEDFIVNKVETKIKRINIERVIINDDNTYTTKVCTSIIGMSDDIITLDTPYKEYLGKVLTEDNMEYCSLEV